jgi:autotransporter translocation and assembly factor TamB
MPRAIVIISVLVAAIAALAVAFIFSPPAMRLAGEIAEGEIEEALGREIEIGAVEGDLFSEFKLLNVRFKDGAAHWAEIASIKIRWKPSALLQRRIEITAVSADNAIILAQPPPSRKTKPIKGFELPERLPMLSIESIRVHNLVVDQAVAGETVRLDGEGSIAMGGRALSINGSLAASDARDALSIKLERDPDTSAIALNAQVRSTSRGAIAALTHSRGPIDILAVGTGMNEDYALRVNGRLGDAGSFDLDARGNLAVLDAAEFTLTARPGARLSGWRGDVGAVATAEGVYRPLERGGRLELRRAVIAGGAISGAAEWRNSQKALDHAAADFSFAFADNWRPTLQAALGSAVDIKVLLERRGENFALTASAAGPLLRFAMRDGKSDLRSRLTGEVELSTEPASSLSWRFPAGLDARAGLSFSRNDEIALEALKITSPEGFQLSADASYAFPDKEISAKGVLSLDEKALTSLLPSLRARGKSAGEFNLKGVAGDISLRMTATTPDLLVNETPIPNARAAISVTGLPSAAAGVVSLRAIDGSRRAAADFSRRRDGLWRLRSIDYRGRGFAMRGGLDFNPQTGEGDINLSYEGGDGAEPWPGVFVEGAARASGALSRTGAPSRLTLDVASLRRGNFRLEDFRLTVKGPYKKLSLDAFAASLGANGRVQLKDLRLSGTAVTEPETAFTLAGASVDVNGSPVVITNPANFTFGDGVAVQGLKLKIGQSGVVDLDGSFRRSYWQAIVDVRDVRLPDALSTASLSLVLDTRRIPLATGEFEVLSVITRSETLTLPGRLSWDGRQLEVLAEGADQALNVDLALPLVLNRAGQLSVSFAGPISGSARYLGRAESIAIFLPAALQSLEGALDFAGSISGDIKNPRVDGRLQLTDGAYTELASGFSIVDIDLKAVAARSVEASTVKFSATASGAGQTQKSITATGSLDFQDDLRLKTELALDRARFSGGPIESVSTSGGLTVEGAPDDLLVSGDLKIHALTSELFKPKDTGLVDIEVVAINGDRFSSSPGPAATRRKGNLRYAIRFTADDNIVVRGRGLDSTWRANAQIVGERDRPLVLGVLNLQRGDLEFSGRRFNLARGSIGFDTLAPNDPTIDIRAERETREGVTVAVIISGRSSALKVSLESTPSRANEDIMALILFDKPADQLSAFESLQVADALTQLGGVGVFGGKGVAGAARDALGVDLLNLEIDETDSSASLLTVGKYVTDGLFISASQNARGENGSLRIEYEIGSSFSVETELRQDGDQTISANWKKDF